MTTHFPDPSHNSCSAGTNAWVADTSIFGERALRPGWSHPHSLFISLKQHSVARPNAQRAANLAGYGDLTFAGDFRLFFQESLVPYFTTRHLTLKRFGIVRHGSFSKRATSLPKAAFTPYGPVVP
jgi:hypothetical protein